MKSETWHRLMKNKLAMIGLFILVILILCAIFADFLAPYGSNDQNIPERLSAPSAKHIMGTDQMGRDIFSRLLFGARVTISVGFIVVLITSMLATIFGLITGYYGRLVDEITMRFMDIMMSIPSILLAIAIVATLGIGLVNTAIAMIITSIPHSARLIRGAVMVERNKEYIEAARASNASDFRILVKYIFPNILSVVIVDTSLRLAVSILTLASLSFIGLGAQPPIPEWGTMLSEGRSYIRNYPWMVFYPGLAIALVIFALNMLGDGLRDALDPRLKGGKK